MPPVCLGVIFHWLGGLASGSFYVPYKAVKKWSWEVYWLAGGFFSWIIAPWIMAMILTGGLFPSLSEVFSGKVGESTVQYAIDNPTHVSSGIFRQDTILEAYNQNPAAFNNVRKEKVKVDANGKFDKNGESTVLCPTPEILSCAWIASSSKSEKDKEMTEKKFADAWNKGFGANVEKSQVDAGALDAQVVEILKNDLAVAYENSAKAMGYAFLFGCLWGIGGLTFGLTMRYLGMSLGMAIALGYCTVLGTIMPDIFKGTFISNITTQPPYAVIILGLGVCLLGVILAGVAGMSKEREMPEEVKKEAIKEFNFLKGILVATISGVFSACMAYGLQAAEPLAVISAAHGTGDLWVGLPKLCVVLLGGFTTNFIWCAILLNKNKTTYQFFNKEVNDPDVPAVDGKPAKATVNMIWNYFFSALAGTTWYFQFFFYSMGETRMGEYKFSSWTLHMASIIIFSSCWGLALHEWRGSSKFTKFILGCAIFTLLYSTIVVGYGNLMKQTSAEAAEAPAAVAVEGETDAPQIDAAPADAPAADAAEQAEPVAEPAADVPAEGAFVAPQYDYVFA